MKLHVASTELHRTRLATSLRLVIGLLCLAGPASAQVRRDALTAFKQQRAAESQRLRAEAETRASQLGLPTRRTFANGAVVVELKWFVDGRPLYYVTDNLNAARTVSTDRVWAGGGVGLFLDGLGQTLSIWDGGNVRATHVELAGRTINLEGAGLSNIQLV